MINADKVTQAHLEIIRKSAEQNNQLVNVIRDQEYNQSIIGLPLIDKSEQAELQRELADEINKPW